VHSSSVQLQVVLSGFPAALYVNLAKVSTHATYCAHFRNLGMLLGGGLRASAAHGDACILLATAHELSTSRRRSCRAASHCGTYNLNCHAHAQTAHSTCVMDICSLQVEFVTNLAKGAETTREASLLHDITSIEGQGRCLSRGQS
jgi:hypothetical protein